MVENLSPHASAATYGDLIYSVGDGEVTITDCDTSATGALEIPATISGYPVTTIGGSAFANCTGLTSVTIPDSVTTIGNWAFEVCTGLTSVTIPDSVTTIGHYAFLDCSRLTSITIPDSVTTISDGAFYGCTGLTSVTIPDGVTTIGRYAFRNCSRLTSITIPDSVITIGDGAFEYCTGLTSVTIPDSVTTIDRLAFCACYKLTSVTIGNSVTTIGSSAFANCTGLTSVTIPDSVTTIGNWAFEVCTGLTSVTIPDGVTTIGDGAFRNCYRLTSITIPDGVTTIGEYAFSDCFGLTSVYITDLAKWCAIDFDGYYSNPLYYADFLYLNGDLITDLVIPEGVTALPYCAFSCQNITSVTIPDNVTTIGSSAFANCTGLTSVTIPDSVTTIGHYAFLDCSRLTSITIPDSVTTISDGAFYGCTGLTSVTIPDGVTTIGRYAFEDCFALKDVWYTGTEGQKNQMEILGYNEALKNATWHYNSCLKGGNHSYDNACDAICNKCNTSRDVAGHKYSNACDTDCNVCKATRTIAHKFSGYVYNNDATASKDGTKTRACSICKKTETVTATGTKLVNPFKDVKANEYYTEPVLWAVGKKITNGMSETSFAPNNECTRGQIVTFLWRAAGSPEPTSTKNPFVDVKSDQYYYKAVLWAVEKGITTGTSANTFSPDAGCTRGQVVTFLHRAKGKPASSGKNAFADVKSGAYYYDAVRWAVKNSITNGMSANSFAPDATCTRGQIVTFLYRAYN